MQLDTAWAHVIDVGLGGGMSIFKAAPLFRFAPKHLVVAVRIKWRVDVAQIDARCWEFSQLIEIIAAVDNASVDERRRLCRHFPRVCRNFGFWSTRLRIKSAVTDHRYSLARLNIASIDLRDAKVTPNDRTMARTRPRGTFTVRCKAAAPASSKRESVRAPIKAGRTVAARTRRFWIAREYCTPHSSPAFAFSSQLS